MTTISFMSKDGFFDFFPVCIHFISFTTLVVSANASTAVLKSSSERRYFVLFPILV